MALGGGAQAFIKLSSALSVGLVKCTSAEFWSL
jgi:hypothetical protein